MGGKRDEGKRDKGKRDETKPDAGVVRVGGGRRMRDIKCFNANYQKSELKNIDYLLF